ncbi:hypothetical protein ABZ749_23655 [Micromonospora sp. NPDC047753]|uniref:hypothetical protein n=1 Tax=Micromonospora sp. NPDC047753 TaxID=3154817 RepID=UPI0033CF29F9
MSANTDGSRTLKSRNTASNDQPGPSTNRKVKIVATGGCGTLLASSLTQAFSLVPAGLQSEFHGSLAFGATIGLLYLALPRKAKITLEWER